MGASFAGKVVIKRSGTAVGMTDETVHRGGTNEFQIADADKRVIDPTFLLTIEENAGGSWRTVSTHRNGVQLPGSIRNYDVDYLGGVFVRGSLVDPSQPNIPGTSTPWPASPAANTVRVTGQYLPMVVIGGGNNYSISSTREGLDATTFETEGLRDRVYGLFDTTITVGKLYLTPDGSARTENLADLMRDETPVVFEYRSTNRRANDYDISSLNKYDIVRAWVLLDSIGSGGGVGDLEAQDLNFMLTGHTGGFVPIMFYRN